jgi:hypothetical protein
MSVFTHSHGSLTILENPAPDGIDSRSCAQNLRQKKFDQNPYFSGDQQYLSMITQINFQPTNSPNVLPKYHIAVIP